MPSTQLFSRGREVNAKREIKLQVARTARHRTRKPSAYAVSDSPAASEKSRYKLELRALQIELVKLQRHLIRHDQKILIIFEGRDAAGKDGTIKRITQHLSPRETRVVALGKPSDREQSAWYFQRYVAFLPTAQEMVLFNRSWYNRAGVEKVMGFCTEEQYQDFMGSVLAFEYMLMRAGIVLFKYYLDISKAEQSARLKQRKQDPLTQWKVSPIDGKALKYWRAYSQARDAMLVHTHDAMSPWRIVRADEKPSARLNIIRDLLHSLSYAGKDQALVMPDRQVVAEFDPSFLKNGVLAH